MIKKKLHVFRKKRGKICGKLLKSVENCDRIKSGGAKGNKNASVKPRQNPVLRLRERFMQPPEQYDSVARLPFANEGNYETEEIDHAVCSVCDLYCGKRSGSAALVRHPRRRFVCV